MDRGRLDRYNHVLRVSTINPNLFPLSFIDLYNTQYHLHPAAPSDLGRQRACVERSRGHCSFLHLRRPCDYLVHLGSATRGTSHHAHVVVEESDPSRGVYRGVFYVWYIHCHGVLFAAAGKGLYSTDIWFICCPPFLHDLFI